MKRLIITGNVILDTDTTLVSGSATIKSINTVHIVDLINIGNNQANFTLDTEHAVLIKDGSCNVSVQCFDIENNHYSISLDGMYYGDKELEDNVQLHSQYLVNSDCLLSKDIMKLLSSN